MSLNRGSILSNQQSRFGQMLIPLTIIGGLCVGLILAYLVVNDQCPYAIILLGVLPAFMLLHRYPFFALLLWLLVLPLVVDGNGGMIRRVYWVIHRALPAATILIMVLRSMLGVTKRRLPRLGFPELAMAGYVVITIISIFYTRSDTLAALSNEVPFLKGYHYEDIPLNNKAKQFDEEIAE